MRYEHDGPDLLEKGDKIRLIAMGYEGEVTETRGTGADGTERMYRCRWSNGGLSGWLYRQEIEEIANGRADAMF